MIHINKAGTPKNWVDRKLKTTRREKSPEAVYRLFGHD